VRALPPPVPAPPPGGRHPQTPGRRAAPPHRGAATTRSPGHAPHNVPHNAPAPSSRRGRPAAAATTAPVWIRVGGDGARSPQRWAAPPPEVDRERLAAVMAAAAAGDPGAPVTLASEFAAPLGAVVRSELRRHHVHRVDNDDLGGLVLDCAFALVDCAGAWDPDGALPWTWARARLVAVVSAWVGQFAESFEVERHDRMGNASTVWGSHEPAFTDVLHHLAARNPVVALVREALDEVGSARDQELLLTYAAQQRAGDHSPAVTLSAMSGLSPDAVRQRVSRMRRSLRKLAQSDPRFAVLADLDLLG